MSTIGRATAILTAAALAIGLTACAGGTGAKAPAKPTTSPSTASPTTTPLSVYDANTTLAKIHVTDACSPTLKEVDALDQALVDEHGVTKTSAHGFTISYLTQTCTDKKTQAAENAKAAAIKNPKSYAPISKRALAKVFKNPDAFAGNKYLVYGRVTQFDSGTGPDQFRADVAYTDTRSQNYGYFNDGENAMISAGAADVSDIVADDIVKMYVEVVGSLTYDTSIGGSTTVPQFTVNIIKRIGTSK
jgi:hypothetical protein